MSADQVQLHAALGKLLGRSVEDAAVLELVSAVIKLINAVAGPVVREEVPHEPSSRGQRRSLS